MFSAIANTLNSVALTAMTAMAPILTDSGTAGTPSENFDIIGFLGNTTGYVKNIGHYIMMLAGAILIIVAAVQIVKGLASGGRGQVNWVMSIACLLVGGLLLFGGWNLAASVAKIGANTMEQINDNTYSGAIQDNGGSGMKTS
jgi:hypothetical protein